MNHLIMNFLKPRLAAGALCFYLVITSSLALGGEDVDDAPREAAGAGGPYTLESAAIVSGAAVFPDGTSIVVGQPVVGTVSNGEYTIEFGLLPAEGTSCESIADCADLNGDGIRDDGCTNWACEQGQCLGTDITYADMGGLNGACAPDGTADGNDRFHALNCFSNRTTSGATGYPCEAAPPTAYNVDAAGLAAPCQPDGVCDGNDAFAAINAFAGNTTCACSQGPAPTAPGALAMSASTTLELQASQDRIAPGGTVEVHAFLGDAVDDLRGYQLHVTVDRRGLELIDMVIEPRKDRVTHLADGWAAFNVDTRQLVVGTDGLGAFAGEQAYLATFVFKADERASGEFVIELLHDATDQSHRTVLFPTPAEETIGITSARPAYVVVSPAPKR